MPFAFVVYGTPQPQGSARAFYVKKLGRAVITSDNARMKPWRQQITGTALASMNGQKKFTRDTPVRVDAVFYFERPKSARKRLGKTTKPDLDKLLRALLDSLTGVLFEDDSQVVQCNVSKEYHSPERVEVYVAGSKNLPIPLLEETEAAHV